MYIAITQVDFVTRLRCTEAPMSYGPFVPEIKGLQIEWENSSKFPLPLTPEGVCIIPALFYGTCDDDAVIPASTLVGVYSEEEYNILRHEEYIARRPYPSWIGNETTMEWVPPRAYPIDSNQYVWGEETLSWVKF